MSCPLVRVKRCNLLSSVLKITTRCGRLLFLFFMKNGCLGAYFVDRWSWVVCVCVRLCVHLACFWVVNAWIILHLDLYDLTKNKCGRACMWLSFWFWTYLPIVVYARVHVCENARALVKLFTLWFFIFFCVYKFSLSLVQYCTFLNLPNHLKASSCSFPVILTSPSRLVFPPQTSFTTVFFPSYINF